MSHRCFDEDELAAICDLPPDDPRRREVETCPRCDSLLRAMSAFLADDDIFPPLIDMFRIIGSQP